MGQITQSQKKCSSIICIFFIFTILAIKGASSLSFAQEKKKQEITYDVAVTAISIAVSVQNRKGRHITDLRKEDFFVYENNQKKRHNLFQLQF